MRGKIYSEVIFQNYKEAMERAAEKGSENVINGTIGALTDKGSLVTFQAVDSVLPNLDIKRLSAYSPIQGYPEFIEASKYFCFGDHAPTKAVAGVAVAGGLGGIHQAIVNYTELHDVVLTADWFWGPYKGLIQDNDRKQQTFNVFKDNGFDLESFKESVDGIAAKQDSVFVIFNSPANNPTGYTLAPEEWDAVISYLNGMDRNIVLFLDSAYLDYAGTEEKKFFKKLDNLSDNVLAIVDYSLSKSFAKYGVRTAALLAVHSDQKVLDEFFNIITLSNRANYGSVNSAGQLMAMAVYENKETLAAYEKEFSQWKQILNERAEIFLAHIDNQIITPYRHGFFASIKTSNPLEDTNRLKEENIFLVPLNQGIRVALCSIEKDQLELLATTINKHISRK